MIEHMRKRSWRALIAITCQVRVLQTVFAQQPGGLRLTIVVATLGAYRRPGRLPVPGRRDRRGP